MNALSSGKVAVCYSGLPNIEISAVDAFFDGIGVAASNIDLICCFWNINVDRKKIDTLANKFHNAHIFYIDPEIPYFPLSWKYYKFPETRVDRVLSMLLVRKRLLDLIKERGLFFEYYIITRPDIFFTKKINSEAIFKNLRGGCNLYLPKAGNFKNGFTDVLALANRIGLEIYLNAFNKLEQILGARDRYVHPETLMGIIREIHSFFCLMAMGRVDCIGHQTPFHPETIVRRNLELCGLSADFVDVGFIKIKRNDGISVLMEDSKTSTFLLARSLMIESLNEVEMSLESLFKVGK
jgi:hypothetical protein